MRMARRLNPAVEVGSPEHSTARVAGSRAPREAVAALEASPRLPAGTWDRFSGYGVLGVGFASGHILALRRIAASSVGPAFTTVWHRDPAGRWTFFVDAEPALTCARYFGSAGRIIREDEIALGWHGPTSFSVRLPGPGIAWAVHLAPAPGARTLAALRQLRDRLPESLRRYAGVERTLATAAGRLLRLDQRTLAGRTPSGHGFRLDTHQFWTIDASTARWRGEHLGPPVTVRTRARLGDFVIPAWGVFTIGDAFFEPYRSSI
jgi:hypothetical protein